MKRIGLICPNSWDAAQLPRVQARLNGRYQVVPYGIDAEHDPAGFDALRFLDEALDHFRQHPVDGVASSSDYPGVLVAAALAHEMGLPGPSPDAVFRCSHKFYSRLAQLEIAPEATPAFGLVDPAMVVRGEPVRLLGTSSMAEKHDRGDGGRKCADEAVFPLFVKPVKSWFSVLARRVENAAALRRFIEEPETQTHLTAFVRPFNQLLRRYTNFEHDGSYLLAETLLSGMQVTVEGFVCDGEAQIAGVVDSVMFPGTISFQRFDYPSYLSADVQERMEQIAARVATHIGLDRTLFNVELFYHPETNDIWIIEINPRMCGQFADLYEMVDGTNTYEVLLALAAGDRPAWRAGAGRFRVAASFPLRVFEDQLVRRVPDAFDVQAVQDRWPVTLVKAYCRPGQPLSESNQGDGASWRYGMVNMAGHSLEGMLSDFERVLARLGFLLSDVPARQARTEHSSRP